MKRSLIAAVLFVAAAFSYFLSEALLRRQVYNIRATSPTGKNELIKRLPTFLQRYFQKQQEIAAIEAKLKATEDPSQRVKLMYELSGKVSPRRNRELMEQVIEEAPDSPATTQAWSVVLRDMAEEEILARYLAYIDRCDIRRKRQKVRVWETGYYALRAASREARMTYLERMVEARVISASLAPVYEKLWYEKEAQGDETMAREAKSLYLLCNKLMLAESLEEQ